MPTLNDIQNEIARRRNSAQDDVRRKYLSDLAKHTGRDTVLYASGWLSSKKFQNIPPQLFSLTTEDVQGFMASLNGLKNDNLDLIIHSPGGSLEAVDQIVQYLRAKYKHIRAIIPHNAMSAATMLACACDEIIMGKQSALGPIDPQISWMASSGMIVSSAAQSILDELDMAKSDIAKDIKLGTIWAPRLKDYPPGIYETCKTTITNSKSKVGEWLGKYMLAGVSGGKRKAKAISDWLGKAAEHKTHGRPIGYDVCKSEGLAVKRLEDDNTLQDLVLSVFHASAVTFETTQCVKIIENGEGRGHFLLINAPRS